MYLSLYEIKNSRIALGWIGNRYRVHQRLRMAYRDEPRLLYRIEELEGKTRILAQSSTKPDWEDAFSDFDVLASTPQIKELRLENLNKDGYLRFKLVANPVVTRDHRRLGLFKEEEQVDWLRRQLEKSGAVLKEVTTRAVGLERSEKNPAKEKHIQTHYGVEFNGVLQVDDVALLTQRMREGIGPAKAYGFGLLTVARFSCM